MFIPILQSLVNNRYIIIPIDVYVTYLLYVSGVHCIYVFKHLETVVHPSIDLNPKLFTIFLSYLKNHVHLDLFRGIFYMDALRTRTSRIRIIFWEYVLFPCTTVALVIFSERLTLTFRKWTGILQEGNLSSLASPPFVAFLRKLRCKLCKLFRRYFIHLKF